MIANRTLTNIGLIFIVGFLLYAQWAFTSERTNNITASQILRKKGKTVEKDIKTWVPDKKTTKNWNTLKNKYFTISYPKCYEPRIDGEGDTIENTTGILLKENSSCIKHISKDIPNDLSIIVEYRLKPNDNLDYAGTNNALFIQKLNINKISAKYISEIHDEDNMIQLSWIIYMICNSYMIGIRYNLPSGQASLKKIEKSDYATAQKIVDIISTFQCDNNGTKIIK